MFKDEKMKLEVEPVGIELHEKQVEAINNGATAFIVMVDEKYLDDSKDNNLFDTTHNRLFYNNFIINYSPLQVGQKFFIQEEFAESYTPCGTVFSHYVYKSDVRYSNNKCIDWQDVIKMTYELSRLKDFTTATIEVKRLEDVDMDERIKLVPQNLKCGEDGLEIDEWIEDAVDTEHGFGTYESNPCVFIVTSEKE